MSNPLINKKTNEPDINALFQQFKKNPVEFLIKSKLNIPQGMNGNPQEIVRHLYNSGQIPQQILPKVQQMLGAK